MADQNNAIFVMASEKKPDVDVGRRILRNACIGTTALATDGMIMIPGGMETAGYMQNSIVTCRHLAMPAGDITVVPVDSNPIVIARTIAMSNSDDAAIAEVQFADTKLGREYAYLYGVNNSGANGEPETYMRAWSIESSIRETKSATFDQARRISGQYWDDAIAERVRSAKIRMKEPLMISVITRSVLNAFAAVALGADRSALTRAFSTGVEVAGEMLVRIDLSTAQSELAEIKNVVDGQGAVIARLEQDIKALRGEVASAAARGDSEALLEEIRSLNKLVHRN